MSIEEGFTALSGHLSGGVLFVFSNAVAIYLASLFASQLAGSENRLRRMIVGIATFVLIVCAVQLVAAGWGLLTPTWTVVLLCAATAAVHFWRSRHGRRARSLSVSDAARDVFDGTRRNGWFALTWALMSGGLAIWVFGTVILGTRLGIDDLVYHATVAAGWVVNRDLALEPLTYQGYYPFNAELLSSWFMLPFHSDAYASLSALVWASLATVSIVSIVSSVTGSMNRSRLAAAIFLVGVGVIRLHGGQGIMRSFCAADLAGPAMLLAAIALFSGPARSPAADRASPFYMGLLAGFALGVKVMFAPAVVILLVWVALDQWSKEGANAAWQSTLRYCLGAVITGSYWYVRTWIVTGNPLFPAAVGPFEGPFLGPEQRQTTLMYRILQSWNDLDFWRGLAIDTIDSAWLVITLAVAGYLLACSALVRIARGRGRQSVSPAVWILLAIGTVWILILPFVPFSGSINRPFAPVRISPRFLVLPYVFGLVLTCCLWPMRRRWDRALTVGCTLAVALAMAAAREFGLVFLLGAVAAAVVFFLRPFRSRKTRSQWAWRSVAVTGLGWLAVWQPWKSGLSDRELFAHRSNQGVFERLEALPTGWRLGMFSHLSPEHTWYYKLYGRRLQHRPVGLEVDGTAVMPLHDRWRHRLGGWWDHGQQNGRTVTESQFIENLAGSGVRGVIFTRRAQGPWPAQRVHVLNHPGSRSIFRDEYSELWEVISAD